MPTPKVKTFSFGSCEYDRLSPPREKLTASTKVLNIALSFEDAMKLGLAVDECIRKINTYNRSTRAGKKSAVNLAIHLHAERISVNETAL
jgi:hypothetical protein